MTFLSEILNHDLKEIDLKFDFTKRSITKPMTNIKHNQFQKNISFEINQQTSSFNDLVPIEFIATKDQELNGCDNSLFLSVSRFIIYKSEYEKKFCPIIFKNFYLSEINKLLNSDVYLQEVLREKLCRYWLSNVKKNDIGKYSRYFVHHLF